MRRIPSQTAPFSKSLTEKAGGILLAVKPRADREYRFHASGGIADSCPLWRGNGIRYRRILNSSQRALVMANAKCRTCDRAADAGAYCSSCAATIMAKALNPFVGPWRKKRLRPEPPRPFAPSR